MTCYPLRFTFTSTIDTFTCIGRNLSSGGNEVFFFWWRRFCPEVGEDGKCHSSQKSIFYNKLQTRSVIWLYQAIYIKKSVNSKKSTIFPDFPIFPEKWHFGNFWTKFLSGYTILNSCYMGLWFGIIVTSYRHSYQILEIFIISY